LPAGWQVEVDQQLAFLDGAQQEEDLGTGMDSVVCQNLFAIQMGQGVVQGGKKTF